MAERFRPADEMAAMDPPTTDEEGNELSEEEQLEAAQAALDLPMRRILMEAMGFIDMNKWSVAEFNKQIRIGHGSMVPGFQSEMENIRDALNAANKVVLRFYVDRVETLPYELASERAEARGEMSLAEMVTAFLRSQGRNMPANVYNDSDPREAVARAAAERAQQEAEAAAAASRPVDPMAKYRQRPAPRVTSGLYPKGSPTAYSGLGLGGTFALGAPSSGNPRPAALASSGATWGRRGGKKTKKSGNKKRSTRRN
jgi:hypothetical protein